MNLFSAAEHAKPEQHHGVVRGAGLVQRAAGRGSSGPRNGNAAAAAAARAALAARPPSRAFRRESVFPFKTFLFALQPTSKKGMFSIPRVFFAHLVG